MLFVAAFVVDLVHGSGTVTLVAVGVLALVAVAGVAMVQTSRVVYDPAANAIAVSMLGNTQTRSLDGDTRIRIRVATEAGRRNHKYVVKQPGRPALSFYGTINGQAAGLDRLVLAALERNPGLVDESDQGFLR